MAPPTAIAQADRRKDRRRERASILSPSSALGSCASVEAHPVVHVVGLPPLSIPPPSRGTVAPQLVANGVASEWRRRDRRKRTTSRSALAIRRSTSHASSKLASNVSDPLGTRWDPCRRSWNEMEAEKQRWNGFEKFEEVQGILDRNKELIGRINANHDSRAPNRLEENVALIRELNGNIVRVVEIYRNISVDLQESMESDALRAN